MRKRSLIAIFSCLSFLSLAQMDTTVMLISKVDFQPQYPLHDGNLVELMGYTKTIGGALVLPSPTLEFKEGDSVNLNFWNLSQGAPHSIHLHGLDVNQANDGVPMLSFDVAHDDTGSYYFKAPHPGTYLYHCHVTSVVHVQGGMYGMVIVRPQSADTLTWEGGYSFHSERAWLLSELDTNWHHDSILHHPHDTMSMEHVILPYHPQHFLVNGKSENQLLGNVQLNTSVGETVYARLANIGYYANRVIFPSQLHAKSIDSDGRPLPSEVVSDTVWIFPGERYGVLLEADAEFSGAIQVDYVNMNTQLVENSQEIAVNSSGFLGLEQLANEKDWYPNPAKTSIHVGTVERDIRILTVDGRFVTNAKVSNGVIDVSQLTNGYYFMEDKMFNQTKKILILN